MPKVGSEEQTEKYEKLVVAEDLTNNTRDEDDDDDDDDDDDKWHAPDVYEPATDHSTNFEAQVGAAGEAERRKERVKSRGNGSGEQIFYDRISVLEHVRVGMLEC